MSDKDKAVDDLLKILMAPQFTSVADANNYAKKSKSASGRSSKTEAVKKRVRIKQDYSRTSISTAMDNSANKDIVRMQVLNYTHPYWDKAGLSPFLLMTHAHNNQVYNHTLKSLMTHRYVPEQDLTANTSRFGITTDKGFIGFMSDGYKGHHKNNVKELLHISEKTLTDICEKALNKSLHEQRFIDSGFYQESLLKPDNDTWRASTELTSLSSYDNVERLGKDVGLKRLLTGDTCSINLYIIDDIIFTTTTQLKATVVDAAQKNSNFYLPCTGIIQDLLTQFILTCGYGLYYQNGQIQSHTDIIKNPLFEGKAQNRLNHPYLREFSIKSIGLKFDSEEIFITDNIDIPIALFPFLLYQSGNSNSGININYTHFDTNGISHYKNSSKYKEYNIDYMIRNLPIGDIIPIARLFKVEGSDKIFILPISLTENTYYDLDILDLKYLVKINPKCLKTYTELDLISLDKQSMYSQAIVDVVQYINKLMQILEIENYQQDSNANNLLTAVTNIADSSVQNISTQTGYSCPTALITTKDFVI